MICPHDKSQCFLRRCEKGCYDQPTPPPPPTLADIERLVDAYGNARATLLYDGYDYGTAQGTKAAVMAAIRAYWRE